MLQYDELNDILKHCEAESCAADLHGFLCGQICVSGHSDIDIWQEYMNLQSDDRVVVTECYEEIEALVDGLRLALASTDFDFQVLIPEDDTPIATRVEALAEWCHGFLNGFALGQGAEYVLANEENRDVIENFSKICQAAADDNADEGDEEALVDLIEYVRLGAICIFDRLSTYTADDNGAGVLH